LTVHDPRFPNGPPLNGCARSRRDFASLKAFDLHVELEGIAIVTAQALFDLGWRQAGKGYFRHADYGTASFDVHEATSIAKKRVPPPLRPKPCLCRTPLVDTVNGSGTHCFLCGRTVH
jgi:hypothetical protein